MAFRYNTRGNAAPNGKTRVYLYCHPKDFAPFYAGVFGNLQYLDKYHIDETAISYEEKLKKYLNAVLIVAYCGITELAHTKRVIGGKDVALRDFYSFYKQIPMLGFPADSVQYPELWQLLDGYINEKLRQER